MVFPRTLPQPSINCSGRACRARGEMAGLTGPLACSSASTTTAVGLPLRLSPETVGTLVYYEVRSESAAALAKSMNEMLVGGAPKVLCRLDLLLSAEQDSGGSGWRRSKQNCYASGVAFRAFRPSATD